MQGVKRGHQRPGGPVISSLQMRGAKKACACLRRRRRKIGGGIRVSPSQHQARKGPSRGACATCGGRRPVVPSLSSAGGVWGVHVCVRVCVCMCVRVCAMIRVQKTSICRGGGGRNGRLSKTLTMRVVGVVFRGVGGQNAAPSLSGRGGAAKQQKKHTGGEERAGVVRAPKKTAHTHTHTLAPRRACVCVREKEAAAPCVGVNTTAAAAAKKHKKRA